MKAVHLINRHEGITLKGLTPVPWQWRIFRSGCWFFTEEQARLLINGWLYLHPKKSERSEFGGVIKLFEVSAIETGYAFIFEARKEAKGQTWRGDNHRMAWNSGIIDADFEHERRVKQPAQQTEAKK